MAVFGAGGQVGHALTHLATAGAPYQVFPFRRRAVDITDAAAVADALEESRPHVVVNAAAYTAVDRAEVESAAAYAVNRDGAGVVAAACAGAGVDLVHLSTDYVFDGNGRDPYPPGAPLCPLGVYGASKAAGERVVRAAHPQALVLRTSWVFGAHGENFVRSIGNAARTRDALHVVSDQRGCPTPADGLARAIFQILDARGPSPVGAIAHVRGAPPATWYELACAVVARLPPPRPAVHPVSTVEYGAAAPRPMNVVLDMSATSAAWGVEPPSWEEALDRVMEELAGR